jgi:hypothetical protein
MNEQDAKKAMQRFKRHFARRRWVFRTSSGREVEMNFISCLSGFPEPEWSDWLFLTVGYRLAKMQGKPTAVEWREVETGRNELVAEWSKGRGYKISFPNNNGTAAFIDDGQIKTAPIPRERCLDLGTLKL